MIDPKIEGCQPFSDDYIREIEITLGSKVPYDYAFFVQDKGGAFVAGFVDDDDDFPIDRFFDCSEKYGVVATLKLYSDLQEAHILPIADCALGNIWVIDVDGSVSYINYYGGVTRASTVSHNFRDFLERIVVRYE